MFFIIGYSVANGASHFKVFEKIPAVSKSHNFMIMALHRTAHMKEVEQMLRILKKKGQSTNSELYSQICTLSERIFFKLKAMETAKMFTNPQTCAKYREFYGESTLYTKEVAQSIMDGMKWPEPERKLSIELDPEEPYRPIRTYPITSDGRVILQTTEQEPSYGQLFSPRTIVRVAFNFDQALTI